MLSKESLHTKCAITSSCQSTEMTGKVSVVHIFGRLFGKFKCFFFLFFPSTTATIENVTIVERISPDAIIFLQTHKRIWPANQRDALFWSHMRKTHDKDPSAHDEWLVCNHSIELEAYPANKGKCLRIFLTVIMFCQTYIDPAVVASGRKPTRDDITCKITYCSEGECLN